uniref:Ubiquitin-like domain-containing protein n=1 Tax=Caenorhabditis tropicalis TaxID=1561998 RepID=A0A1I7T380_9PELO
MTQELFFEVRRKKAHYYLDAEESDSVSNLKQMIAGILKEPLTNVELWKLDEEGRKTQLLHDSARLVDCGYSSTNAKAQSPAAIGLRLIAADEQLEMTDVSTPPPIPDTMRQDPAPQD